MKLIAIGVVSHVVVLIHSCAKDPEVVDIWDPVEDASLFIEVFNHGVNDHVLSIERYPVVLDHDAHIGWSGTATRVEHSVALLIRVAFKKKLKESSLVTRWNHVVAEAR